eukprot:CAMPEP_0171058728 /NCGR_PEP_ID=MMETSP0766_2-20121228/2692_1 /TAXON_ID=439317 /ORGANISM="Gambierdiscus australes, Strain CAWD 149" /LENGTH=167 /DNA_ID=CAMNT_0011514045 /DNA_START=51 /DNA_END=554 /DNA_ORIENTATION=+
MPSLLVPGGNWRQDVEWWLRTSLMKDLRLQAHADEVEELAEWLQKECPKSLQSLELSVSEFTLSLCVALQGLRIRRLRLWQSVITEAGGEMLFAVLVNNNYVREFELVQNFVEDAAAEFLAEGLARSTHLRLFVLCGNEIGVSGLRILAEAAELNQKCTTRSMGQIS